MLTLATGAVARRAPAHMAVARLVPEVVMPVDVIWREDDDSPVLARFLEVATPAREQGGA